MFAALEATDISDLFRDFYVWITRMDDATGDVSFGDLSDGERQLLMVLGLIRISRGQRVLFLLDEPDTHLNPVWQYIYLDLIQEWTGLSASSEKCHIILSTHNPLVIGGLRKNQVRILARVGERIVAAEPEHDPIGIGIEGLLKSELYGLRSTLAPEILQKLDRHYILLGKKGKTSDEENELMRLAAELNDLGVSRTHPNPYFESFANAMARRRQPEPLLTLSKAEIDDQAMLADDILKEVIADERTGNGGRSP
jgi:ABC-type multidrug transport system ATPase subunit